MLEREKRFVDFGQLQRDWFEVERAVNNLVVITNTAISQVNTIIGGTPTDSAPGDVASAGVSPTGASSDHLHGRESFGAVTAEQTAGLASANGTSTSISHTDHTHGTPGYASYAKLGF